MEHMVEAGLSKSQFGAVSRNEPGCRRTSCSFEDVLHVETSQGKVVNQAFATSSWKCMRDSANCSTRTGMYLADEWEDHRCPHLGRLDHFNKIDFKVLVG